MANVYPQSVRDQVVQEVREVRNAALVARRHELREPLVQRWVRQAARAGRFPVPDPTTMAALTAAEGENRHLKELLGEKDLEIAILKDLVKKADRAPSTVVASRTPGSRGGTA